MPTGKPSRSPTASNPTHAPTDDPTEEPTEEPTPEPSPTTVVRLDASRPIKVNLTGMIVVVSGTAKKANGTVSMRRMVRADFVLQSDRVAVPTGTVPVTGVLLALAGEIDALRVAIDVSHAVPYTTPSRALRLYTPDAGWVDPDTACKARAPVAGLADRTVSASVCTSGALVVLDERGTLNRVCYVGYHGCDCAETALRSDAMHAWLYAASFALHAIAAFVVGYRDGWDRALFVRLGAHAISVTATFMHPVSEGDYDGLTRRAGVTLSTWLLRSTAIAATAVYALLVRPCVGDWKTPHWLSGLIPFSIDGEAHAESRRTSLVMEAHWAWVALYAFHHLLVAGVMALALETVRPLAGLIGAGYAAGISIGISPRALGCGKTPRIAAAIASPIIVAASCAAAAIVISFVPCLNHYGSDRPQVLLP